MIEYPTYYPMYYWNETTKSIESIDKCFAKAMSTEIMNDSQNPRPGRHVDVSADPGIPDKSMPPVVPYQDPSLETQLQVYKNRIKRIITAYGWKFESGRWRHAKLSGSNCQDEHDAISMWVSYLYNCNRGKQWNGTTGQTKDIPVENADGEDSVRRPV
jgi:hypothetical protein